MTFKIDIVMLSVSNKAKLPLIMLYLANCHMFILRVLFCLFLCVLTINFFIFNKTPSNSDIFCSSHDHQERFSAHSSHVSQMERF